jgi:GalNAc-alpha-(1->4)-GalNAc-alpha-(1->3)-diNAcBac-PP-undecaprenol alpha-1,4-N-acetyl-D-galactosaminyltransferase
VKILFFSRGYGNIAGGIEKMSLDLARGLVGRKHEVTILSLDEQSANSFFEWPLGVRWKKLGIGSIENRNTLITRFKRVKAIRKFVKTEKFDVAVGFQVGAFALIRFSIFGLGIRTVAAERNAPTLFNYIKRGKLKRFFSNLILLTSNKIAIQFEDYKIYYPSFLHPKIVITPNWVKQHNQKTNQKRSEFVRVLYLGRISYQKNLDVLVSAFSKLPSDFKLTIAGSGPDKASLMKKVEILNLNRVEFKEPTNGVEELFNNTDFLCLPSRWEGFPNVVAEALSFGIPCIGFALCSGFTELVIDGTSGVIAEGMDDPESLKRALIRASKLEYDSDQIKKTVSQFTYGNYIDKWELALN